MRSRSNRTGMNDAENTHTHTRSLYLYTLSNENLPGHNNKNEQLCRTAVRCPPMLRCDVDVFSRLFVSSSSRMCIEETLVERCGVLDSLWLAASVRIGRCWRVCVCARARASRAYVWIVCVCARARKVINSQRTPSFTRIVRNGNSVSNTFTASAPKSISST